MNAMGDKHGTLKTTLLKSKHGQLANIAAKRGKTVEDILGSA